MHKRAPHSVSQVALHLRLFLEAVLIRLVDAQLADLAIERAFRHE